MRRDSRFSARLLILATVVALSAPLSAAVPVNAAGPQITGIDIKVPIGNRISGTLKNIDGDPLPGLSVVACTTFHPACRSDAVTAVDGSFTIHGLIPDTYVIGFSPFDESDYLGGWYTPGGPVDDPATATPIDATASDVSGINAIAAKGVSISGQVTGPGAIPLTGISVTANGQSHGGIDTTDGAGNYVIRGLADDTYELSIRVPPTLNYRSGSVVDGDVVEESNAGSPIVVSGVDVTGKDVRAPTGLRISGTLTGPEAAGASVSAYGSSSSSPVTIASNGQWSISGLWPGQYQLIFSPAETGGFESVFPLGYWAGGPTLSADPNAAAEVSLTSSNVTGVNASIPTGLTIAGSVSGDDGAPLHDAYVSVCGLSVGCGSTTTNIAGGWALRHVRADSYLVFVGHSQHVGGLFGSGGFAPDEAHARRVAVSTASVGGVDVVLPSGASITGHITGPTDEPIAEAEVVALGTSGISPASPGVDHTGASGAFLLRGLTEDDYVISVSFPLHSDYIRGYFDGGAPSGYTDDFHVATPVAIGDASIGSSYVPITPTRIVDSRTGVGVSGAFSANVPRTFQVRGVSPIPAGAIAVTGNVTVVGQTSAGYVSLTPTATPNPKSSTINFPLGDTRANNFTLPLDATGKLAAVFKAGAGKTAQVLVDITGYFVAGDTHGTYATVPPVRVLDSRTGLGLSGPFAANASKTLSIAGAHGIPADAVAITANLTVVGQTRAGYLSVTPNPTTNPTTSTLNFPVGDTRANGLTAQLNGSGDLSIVYKAATGTAHVLLDVTGYYRNAPGGLLFHAVSPGRVIDSRPGVLASELAGLFSANVPRTAGMVGHAGIPIDAKAITGNLTIVGQTSGGYASITVGPVANPTTSTINFPLGDTRANGATVPLNASGQLSIVYKAATGRKTNVILDVTGYFR